MIFLYLITFIFGLVIGSFLNVCIYRFPRDQSICCPPSHCTSCGKRLGFLDLFPVWSYIFLGGKCRYCKSSISPRYPAIELLTAVIFTALFYRLGITVEFAAAAFLMSVLIIVFFIDLDFMIIPDCLVITGLIGGTLYFIYSFFFKTGFDANWVWWSPLLGAVLGSGFLFIVSILGTILFKTDDAMGGGDIKILAPIGLFLGWRLLVVNLFISIIIAAAAGVILLCAGVAGRKSTIPFGPFISVGTLAALLFGLNIINWYWNLY